MGLKINKMGLIYNDANTSSFGSDFEFNIKTSDYGGKVHIVKCPLCQTPNRIPLSYIKMKLDADKKHKGEHYVDERGSLLSFRCGTCLMPVSTSISKATMDIYGIEEYSDEIGKLGDKLAKQKQDNTFKTTTSQAVERARKSKEYKEHFIDKTEENLTWQEYLKKS